MPETKALTLEAISAAQRDWTRDAADSEQRAAAAASRAMKGFAVAAQRVVANLKALGYPDVPGLRPPHHGVLETIHEVERAVGGRVPPALGIFWTEVGGISLIDLDRYTHVAFWRAHGLPPHGGVCDGLHVDPCDSDFLRFTRQDHRDLHDDPDLPAPEQYPLSLSPDGLHKDNISGGPAYEMRVGGGWLAPVDNLVWSGRMRPRTLPESCDLVSYLRAALLECAGFPGLLGEPGFEGVRDQLLLGVEAF